MLYDGLLTYEEAKTLDSVKSNFDAFRYISIIITFFNSCFRKIWRGACGGYTKMADTIGEKCFQLPSKLYNVLEKIKVVDLILGKIINEKLCLC